MDNVLSEGLGHLMGNRLLDPGCIYNSRRLTVRPALHPSAPYDVLAEIALDESTIDLHLNVLAFVAAGLRYVQLWPPYAILHQHHGRLHQVRPLTDRTMEQLDEMLRLAFNGTRLKALKFREIADSDFEEESGGVSEEAARRLQMNGPGWGLAGHAGELLVTELHARDLVG
eukprot:tig00020563_g11330.t1